LEGKEFYNKQSPTGVRISGAAEGQPTTVILKLIYPSSRIGRGPIPVYSGKCVDPTVIIVGFRDIHNGSLPEKDKWAGS